MEIIIQNLIVVKLCSLNLMIMILQVEVCTEKLVMVMEVQGVVHWILILMMMIGLVKEQP